MPGILQSSPAFAAGLADDAGQDEGLRKRRVALPERLGGSSAGSEMYERGGVSHHFQGSVIGLVEARLNDLRGDDPTPIAGAGRS